MRKWSSSKDAITLCINKGCAVIMSDILLMKKKMSIKSHFGGKKTSRWTVGLCTASAICALWSCISKSGSMETHAALSAVLAGTEYLTSQIALLLFFFFCFLGTELLSVAMQPHPPNCQVQGHIPLLFLPLFLKEKKKKKKDVQRERYFVHELRRARSSTTLRIPHLNKSQYFNIWVLLTY